MTLVFDEDLFPVGGAAQATRHHVFVLATRGAVEFGACSLNEWLRSVRGFASL
jgi:hypothetical protein